MKTTYQVEGMTCMHCVKSVEKAFGNEGLTAKIDLEKKSAELEEKLDSEKFSKMKSILEEEGYTLKEA